MLQLRPTTLLLFTSAALVCGIAGSTAWGATPAAPDPTSLWGLIRQGGWAMVPLTLCSLAGLFLLIHGIRETLPARFYNPSLLPHLAQSLRQRDLPAAADAIAHGRTVLDRSLAVALAKADPDLPDARRDRIEEVLGEALGHEENATAQWIHYLNVVATVAPMIGLLGTVSGMIGAFQTISAGGMGRPELLAGDIGEALITTAVGLCIGIPAMIAYFILRNRLNNRMIETVQAAGELVDHLAGENGDGSEG